MLGRSSDLLGLQHPRFRDRVANKYRAFARTFVRSRSNARRAWITACARGVGTVTVCSHVQMRYVKAVYCRVAPVCLSGKCSAGQRAVHQSYRETMRGCIVTHRLFYHV